MLKAIFVEGIDEISVPGLTQWDTGQKLQITLSSLPKTFEVHFSYKSTNLAYVVDATATDGVCVVDIPNIILTQDSEAYAYVYTSDGSVGETIAVVNLPIRKRQKPTDYAIDVTDIMRYRVLEKKLEELEGTVSRLSEELSEIKENGTGTGETVALDTTLTQEGKASDAKAVGDALAQKLGYETVVSPNLLDESTVVYGSWWNALGELESNDYTTLYHAISVSVSGLTKITISYFKNIEMDNPYFYNYFFVYADGSISAENTPTNSWAETQTLEISTDIVEVRLNIRAPQTFLTDWNIMINEGADVLPYEPYYAKTIIPGVTEKLEDLDNNVDANNPRIVLGSNLFTVVGDTLQVFYKSIIDGDFGNTHIMFKCAKGKNYTRYWEFTPTESEVGSYPITVKLFKNNGDIITEKSCTLNVAVAENPTATVNILCVGDSTMEQGQIPIEASRRIKGTTGTATTPTALSLSNVNFVGRKTNDDNTVGWEGTGGWTYGSYIVSGYNAIRFTVSNATNLNIGAVYQVGDFRLTIAEINVTDGSGNIRCLFHYTTPYTTDFDSIAQSGTLTLYSEDGQDTISFSSWSMEKYQPFEKKAD